MGHLKTNELTKRNEEALRSETWQVARRAMKKEKEIAHFTETPEVKNLDTMKVGETDNVYGVRWGNLVRDYLKTAYSGENTETEIVSWDVTYKVLKREEVTVFYNADGDTLFDVENKRLEKEFEWLMNEDELEGQKEAEPNHADMGMDAKPDSGSVNEVEAKTREEVTALGRNGTPAEMSSAKQKAKEKLEKELKVAKDKSFANPVIGYLLERCEEDEGLAQDVAQDHKTWKKCRDYIYKKAKKRAVDNQAVVRDEVVFEWAEDYYHKDDKAEEEKKAKQEVKRKEKQKKKVAAKKPENQDKHGKTASAPAKKEDEPKKRSEPKKTEKNMEGQMDMFSMI